MIAHQPKPRYFGSARHPATNIQPLIRREMPPRLESFDAVVTEVPPQTDGTLFLGFRPRWWPGEMA
jgi:hypothetical protein